MLSDSYKKEFLEGFKEKKQVQPSPENVPGDAKKKKNQQLKLPLKI